ncbi:hypothetical protein F5Y04DRAFT_269477 [Hypomontagnella monticulosa]|nr:hypothetical protein F5Y04DRAFT_269477 [Hypomontagnella monticulosa]
MLTMTRLPSDSFLPSGAMLDPNQRPMSFAPHLNNHSSSVISPLSLPHALNHLSYLDESNLANLPPSNYSHSPPISSVAPRSQQQQQYLSPRTSPPGIREQRSASLSPTRYRTRSGVTSPSIVAGITSPLDSMSSQALINLLQRREEQNRRLLENWRAERAHLEASRARVEEVYREERAIMDDERMIWVEERTKLERDLDEWKRRAATAEKERDQMAKLVKNTQGKDSPKGKSLDGATDAIIGSIRGGGLGGPGTHPQAASEFRTPSDGPSPSTVPSTFRGPTMPESKPFIPLDPRMQSSSPGMTSPQTQPARIPSIDIHEVIPELEGIRVRPDAVQKTTFTDGKPPSPPAGPKRVSPTTVKQEPARARAMSGELTKEALQAPESDRLTMHAGHTPNHSMSLSRLHTVDSTEATNTADSSGASTPKSHLQKSSQASAPEPSHDNQETDISGAREASKGSDVRCETETDLTGPTAILVAEDDPELKGPLHLRNLPAVDEPFLKALANKLDARTNDMTPTVLKHAHERVSGPQQCVELEAEPIVKAGGDGAHDVHEEPAEEEEVEEEIPLKLKKSSNFGAPLGQLRKPSAF